MNEQVENPFAVVAKHETNVLAETDQQRAIAEVQAAMVIAQRFPRDQVACMDKILQACTRPGLADAATYAYSRGGSDITGPSIRMAEMLAQNWGNMQFGVRELEVRGQESTVEAFAWDVETNVRQVKVFQVRHIRDTKKGSYRLEDQRDIYELVANQGARRLRACILGVIPGDVVDAAVRQCELTLKTKAEVTPERLKGIVEKFGEFKITQQQIEKRIQRRLDAMTPALMVQLGKILNSLRDGMSVAADWFDVEPPAEEATAVERVKEAVKRRGRPPGSTNKPAEEAPKQQPTEPWDGVPEDWADVLPDTSDGGPTYADIVESIKSAITGADFDLCADLIRSHRDRTQADELDKELTARMRLLIAKRDAANNVLPPLPKNAVDHEDPRKS